MQRGGVPGIRAILLCRVGDVACALSLDSVIETMRRLPVDSVAGSPRFVLGISVIRGAPLPVIDVGLLVGQRPTTASRVVTLRVGVRTIALAVDEVLGVRTLDASSLQELPPLLGPGAADTIAAIGHVDGQLLLVLGAARLVPDDALRGLEAASGPR